MSGKKGMGHRHWPKDIKLKAINRHLLDHMSMIDVSKEFGISTGMLSNWIRIYQDEGEDALERRPGNPYAALNTSKNLSEIEHLRLTVARC